MKDLVDNIDNIDKKIKEEENEKRIARKTKESIKAQSDTLRAAEFSMKLKKFANNDKVRESIYGKYKDHLENKKGRIDNIIQVIDDIHRLSVNGDIPPGSELHITKEARNKLIGIARELYSEFADKNLKESIYKDYRASEAQAYLNKKHIGARGKEVTEGTIKNVKLRIQKLNLIECLATGTQVDYSSAIATKYEINKNINASKKQAKDNSNKTFNPQAYQKAREEIVQKLRTKIEKVTDPEINKNINASKKQAKDNSNKTFNPQAYQKAREEIVQKLRTKIEKVTDPEIAFLLTGDYGFRISTVDRLTTAELNVKDATIEVYVEQNKSREMFLSKTSFLGYDDLESQEVLSLIYQRTMLRNFEVADKNGNVPLLKCTEGNLYKGYNRILRRNNIKEGWKGKYHSLRYMYAQNRYDEIRSQMELDYPNENKEFWKIETIKELNYLMGHNPEHPETTMDYVANKW